MSIYDFMTLPSSGDAKIVEKPHHLSEPLLERVPSHTIVPAAEDALIPFPTLDEVAAAHPNLRLARKSKGPSQVRVQSASVTVSEPSQPSKKRRLKKRALEAGFSAPELGQAEGLNEADITNFCAELKDSMERYEGTSIRAASIPTPRLSNILGPPPSVDVAGVSRPTHVGTSAHASTSGHSLALGGSFAGGFVRKSGVKVIRRQMDPLDALARSALSRDAKYDEIPEGDFGTATRGEEIELTLFPLAPDPYQMSYPYEGPRCVQKDFRSDYYSAELGRTKSLLPLELSNRVNVLSALLVSHGYELNSHYTDLVASKVRLQEKFDRKKGDVKLLRSEVTSLDNKLEKVQRDCDALGQENRELRSQRDVASEESRSQGYKNAADKLRTEVTQFIGSGVEGLVQRLLSSDEFDAAHALVASLGINYGVEMGLCMGRTDANFEAAPRKFSNFHIDDEADFNKALVAFPTTPFPFLGKVDVLAGGALSEVTQILPDKLARSATSVLIAPPIVNEALNQVPLNHASDDSSSSS
ncbi:hypothetical protein Tco_0859357 [Tanacetum coccineum]|uniref:Uncharacterized protein n=1 Tax=Tanacetum coccineum TaxID=301880 RepID=A0ABQ5BBS1_9ASTR